MVHSVSWWTRGVQVKLWDPLTTRAILERFRGVFTTRRYTNTRLPYLYLYQWWNWRWRHARVCVVKVRPDDTMETRLFMRRARPSSFRSYRLFAENDVGTTTAETQLLQRKHFTRSWLDLLDLCLVVLSGAYTSIGVDLAGILRDVWRAPKVGRCRVEWGMGRGVPSPAD